MDDIQILTKQLSAEKDTNESMRNEIGRLKYKLSSSEQEVRDLFKSNAMLRNHLLKGQEYSNYLHREMIRGLNDHISESFTGPIIQEEEIPSTSLNQTINSTTIIQKQHEIDSK